MLDHDGLRQRRWFLGDRKIAWNEIAWMKRGWRTDTTYVKSKMEDVQSRSPEFWWDDLSLREKLGSMPPKTLTCMSK
jgi:hypothetical protein